MNRPRDTFLSPALHICNPAGLVLESYSQKFSGRENSFACTCSRIFHLLLRPWRLSCAGHLQDCHSGFPAHNHAIHATGTPLPTRRKMSAWLIWTLVALLAWGIWAVISKLLGSLLTAEQSQVLSTLGMLPLFIPLAKKVQWRRLSYKGIAWAILGGIVSCLGNIFYYGALARGERVATVVPLTALYPLVTVFLALLFLRERLNLMQKFGVILSLVAIWLFNVQSDSQLLSATIVFAIGPIVLWGLSGFAQKVTTNDLSPEAASLFYLGAFVPFGAVLALNTSWPASIAARAWGLVLALGFFLAFGNVAILIAFARGGKAAVITPLGGLYPVISVPVAMAFLHEKISARELAGIILALASVAALSWETAPQPAVVHPEPQTKT